MSTRERYKAELEALLDGGHTVSDIMDMLSEVCAEKAEHLRHEWQDTYSAKFWEAASKQLSKAAAHKTFNKGV